MLYYSHINEDSSPERLLLKSASFTEVVAIGGSGERVIALMDADVRKICVVDCNPEAIYLLQLKLTALIHLGAEKYLEFIGHLETGKTNRVEMFLTIEMHLPLSCREYWRFHMHKIRKGILNAGHFEDFLASVRPIIRLWLGRKFDRIFERPYEADNFPPWRWKIVASAFSQRWIYKLFGNRDMAFIGPNTASKHIPDALERIISAGRASSCFMAHLVFKGHLRLMKGSELPWSLQPDILTRIREKLISNTIEVEYYCEDLEDFQRAFVPGSNSVFYSFSDIMSFHNHDYLYRVMSAIRNGDHLVVGRTFLRNRLTTLELRQLESFGKVRSLDSLESTGMYQVFSIETGIQKEKSPGSHVLQPHTI